MHLHMRQSAHNQHRTKRHPSCDSCTGAAAAGLRRWAAHCAGAAGGGDPRTLEDEPDEKRDAPSRPSDSSPRGFDRHADLLLIRGGTQLYVDVSITRLTKASSLRSSAAVCQETLVCAQQVAAAKHCKYDSIANANQYKMLPFVLESYGGSVRRPVAHCISRCSSRLRNSH